MASDKKPFIATDELQHRYADSEVLRKALQVMGFKDKDIDISGSESDGLRVNLPKQLTDAQKQTIFDKFEEEHEARLL